MRTEFRAVVVCSSDPCSYCRWPADRYPEEGGGPYTDAEAAREHGRAMSRNVYGSSAHRVEVETRQVTEWSTR